MHSGNGCLTPFNRFATLVLALHPSLPSPSSPLSTNHSQLLTVAVDSTLCIRFLLKKSMAAWSRSITFRKSSTLPTVPHISPLSLQTEQARHWSTRMHTRTHARTHTHTKHTPLFSVLKASYKLHLEHNYYFHVSSTFII